MALKMALERATANYVALKAGVQELAEGPAGNTAIEAKLRKLSQEDIPKRCPTHYLGNSFLAC